MRQHYEGRDVYLTEYLKVNNKNGNTEKYWFPTLVEPDDPTTYTPIQSDYSKNYSKFKRY